MQPPGFPPGGGGYGPPPSGSYSPPPAPPGGGFGPPPGGYGPPPPGGYGPPPGGAYGPPPGGFVGATPAPMPPKKSGGPNIALIVVIALAILAATGLGGCLICMYIGSRAASNPAPAPATTDTSGTTGTSPTSTWITSERPYVKFLAPPGWAKTLKGDWGVFRSGDGQAVFAFTTFDQPGESTARLGKAAWALGVDGIEWGAPRSGFVGLNDGFKARMAEGTCNFNGPGGYIWYATVDSGTSDQILLIYTVSSRGTKAHKDAALTSIRSLQKR